MAMMRAPSRFDYIRRMRWLDKPVAVRALGAWLLIGSGAALQAWLTWFGPRNDLLVQLAEAGPGSDPYLTATAVVLAWLTLGVALAILTSGAMTLRKVSVVLAYAAITLLYVNVMRERVGYGDFADYYNAAVSLLNGTPMPQRYLYPPLWATLLTPLVPSGPEATLVLVWTLNLVSTVAVLLVLPRVLERYGLSRPLAITVTLLFGAVNVPILRTLSYAQINMEVLLGILLALHWYPRNRFLSALALAIAVHLKLSPIALAMAFLWVRDLEWLALFAVWLLAIAVVPAGEFGFRPYADLVHNLQTIERANGLIFRDNSIDSFLRATSLATGTDAYLLIWPAKAVLAAVCLALAVIHVRRRTFVRAEAPGAAVLNAIPALMVLMVMVAPLVWEHHPVLLGLSYMVVATVLRPSDFVLFGFAYFLEFLTPTFDFFPWSYGRLISPLILLALAWQRAADPYRDGLSRANRLIVETEEPVSDRARTESL
jgi:hypothetical protein